MEMVVLFWSNDVEAELVVASVPPLQINHAPNCSNKASLQVLGTRILIFNTWGTSPSILTGYFLSHTNVNRDRHVFWQS
jgi:hypothetical protein